MKDDNILYVISEKLDRIQKSFGESDLQKGKSDRDGLIQQIVTYVRDGKTIVRKQWVRSGFAQHSKRNEEQKRQAEIKASKREEKADQRKIKEADEKKRNEDKKQYKKVKTRSAELRGGKNGTKLSKIAQDKKKIQRLNKQEQEKAKKNKSQSKKLNEEKAKEEYNTKTSKPS